MSRGKGPGCTVLGCTRRAAGRVLIDAGDVEVEPVGDTENRVGLVCPDHAQQIFMDPAGWYLVQGVEVPDRVWLIDEYAWADDRRPADRGRSCQGGGTPPRRAGQAASGAG